jgi:hypothetical protein
MISSQTALRLVLLLDVIISASLYFARYACCSTIQLEIVDMHLRTSLFDIYLMHLFRVFILLIVYSDLDGFAIQLAAPATAKHFVLRNTLTLAAPFVCAVWVVIRFLLIGSAFEAESVPSIQTTSESRSLTFAFLALQLLFCVFEAAFRRLVTTMRKRWLYADLDNANSDDPAAPPVRSPQSPAAVGQLAFNAPPSSSDESDVDRNNTNDDNLDFLLSKLDALIRKQPLDKPAAQRLANSIQLESRAAAANLRSDDAAKLLAAARALVDATLTLESAASLSSHLAQMRALKPASGLRVGESSEDDGAYLQRRRRDNYDAVGGDAAAAAEDDDDDENDNDNDDARRDESEEVNLLA